MKDSHIAILDLGTNTFHLLIAVIHDDQFRIIHRKKFDVKLGEGGINRRFITDEAWQRGITAIREIKELISSYHVMEIRSIATSAIRNAKNGSSFLEAIQLETGIKTSIIDGNLEAEYIYYGVRQAITIGTKPVLIMDIGGGSVEFIIANQREIFWKKSFEIGAQRLYDLFHRHDPVSPEDILNLKSYLELALHPLVPVLNKFRPDTLIGCSGTFETLSSIYCMRNSIRQIKYKKEVPIDKEAFFPIHYELVTKNKTERLAIPGMSPMRVDMISMSSLLIHYMLTKFSFLHLKGSSYSLKEGLLSEIVDHVQIVELSA
ncbi:MAG: exopolyphosphatase [Cyclobacteriaceae bacterium]|nr:exopolyphosphatase [Cyclobacteriaceae bacterium]